MNAVQGKNKFEQNGMTNSSNQLSGFAIYCCIGLFGISYLTSRTYQSLRETNFKKGRFKGMKGSVMVKNIFLTITFSTCYIVGVGYFWKKIKPAEKILQQITENMNIYGKKVIADPILLDYHITKKLHYFGISDQLIDRIIKQLKQQPQLKQLERNKMKNQISFQKQLIQYVLAKETIKKDINKLQHQQ